MQNFSGFQWSPLSEIGSRRLFMFSFCQNFYVSGLLIVRIAWECPLTFFCFSWENNRFFDGTVWRRTVGVTMQKYFNKLTIHQQFQNRSKFCLYWRNECATVLCHTNKLIFTSIFMPQPRTILFTKTRRGLPGLAHLRRNLGRASGLTVKLKYWTWGLTWSPGSYLITWFCCSVRSLSVFRLPRRSLTVHLTNILNNILRGKQRESFKHGLTLQIISLNEFSLLSTNIGRAAR